ncbi:MAG: DUF2254 domain-containing protein [Micrococcales bacterium]|nr:DUF2254 domain-containing protein [Micrococcales bacterium]
MHLLREKLRTSYWLVPALCLIAAVLLSSVLVAVDEGLQRRGAQWAFAGGPESARSLLSTIATSMMTLTALVFSITMVVLQLAGSQFSPRALPTFLRDRQNQTTLGVFLATYVYALLALRQIRGADAVTSAFVPSITITVAFVLVVVCVGMFVAYIHHIATSIQVAQIVRRIEAKSRAVIEREYPLAATGVDDEPVPSAPAGCALLGSLRAGTVVAADVRGAVDLATELDTVVHVLARPGDFVAAGQPLVACERPGDHSERLLRVVQVAGRRDESDDATFGLQQLVDIAVRALSPGVNDPSTAVECLDRTHELLRQLSVRQYPQQVFDDRDGRSRVVFPRVTWEEHVGLVFDEIRLWGRDSLRVRRRLQDMLDDLLRAAPPARRNALRERLPLFQDDLRIG